MNLLIRIARKKREKSTLSDVIDDITKYFSEVLPRMRERERKE